MGKAGEKRLYQIINRFDISVDRYQAIGRFDEMSQKYKLGFRIEGSSMLVELAPMTANDNEIRTRLSKDCPIPRGPGFDSYISKNLKISSM